MKRISVSVVALLFLCLIINVNPINAYPGGLLNGKPMILSANNGGIAVETYNVTDNNTSTGIAVSYSRGARPMLSYTVPNKTFNLTGFEMRSTGGSFTLSFYNASGTLIRQWNTPGNGNAKIGAVMPNVAKIVLRNNNTNGMTVYEFDVYGTIDLSIPQNLKAVPDTRSGHLTWDALTDSDLAGYNVYVDDTKVNSELVTTNSYTVSGLTPDQKYNVYVSSVFDTGDESVASDSVDLTPYDDPMGQIALNVSPYVDHLAFSWNADDKANTYSVIDADTGQTIVSGLSSPVYNIGNLEPNTTRTVYVVGTDKYGRTVTSNTVSSTTREPPPVTVPVLYVESKTFENVRLRWNQSGIRYQVFINGVPSGFTNSNFYTVTGLEPETEYTFSVVATDEYARETRSNFLVVKTDPLPAPYGLSVSVSSITSSSARLTYTSSFISYKVLVNGAVVRESTSTFHQFYDLTPNTSYEVQIVGTDKYGREVESNVLNFKTLEVVVKPPTPPPEPPPPVSESNNPDLNTVNDHLVQGAIDSKDNALLLIPIILGILLLVFGSWWLVRVFKKKMAKSTGSSGSSGSGASGGNSLKRSIPVGKPMNAPTMKTLGKSSSIRYNNSNSNSNSRRKNYYVEKSYRGRTKGKR